MCGRFALNEIPRKLAEHFDLASAFALAHPCNIVPSTRCWRRCLASGNTYRLPADIFHVNLHYRQNIVDN